MEDQIKKQVTELEPKPLLAEVVGKLDKTMKVSLKQFFSIGDGRLSTEIGDVYEMLNFIFDANFMTHQLPSAMRKLKEVNPDWFSNAVSIINDVKRTNNTNDFAELMNLIDKNFPTYEFELGKCEGQIPFFAGLV
ncbi:hypothetical protein EZJ43_16715 [Pedobacter changchengzhani]|uniref:DUF7736 domain-containing protein n=1 Tax=Pedobacter changchengzhani TaxID=2529274 RepID=A0A4R5MHN9_9SPHI|nr:hypothetical protein [Pedobacter changchengzhani]TDG34816.1 hypothetical protein EZJ43_16715 [Pedobacter changchengzhani]